MATTGPNEMSHPRTRITTLRTVGAFANGRACSDTLFHMIAGGYGHPMLNEERAVMPMAGGIVQHGYQCGALWGAALAAGAEACRRFGAGPEREARALLASRALVEAFRTQNPSADCVDLTDIDQRSSTLKMVTFFLAKGGTFRCFRRVGRFAPLAFEAIQAAFDAPAPAAPETPASCAALLARKLGATEEQRIMAAGLAGGIGLTGGACGALGAAIWLAGVRTLAGGATKLNWKSPAVAGIIERFQRATEYEFECANIVGRRFDGVADHAAYLYEGGCGPLLEALAEEA